MKKDAVRENSPSRFTPNTPGVMSGGSLHDKTRNEKFIGKSSPKDTAIREGKIFRVMMRDHPSNMSKKWIEVDVLNVDGIVYRNVIIGYPLGTQGKYDDTHIFPHQPETPNRNPMTVPYTELEGERVLTAPLDGDGVRRVAICSLGFESTTWPKPPSGPTVDSGKLTKYTIRGVSLMIDENGELTISVPETTAEGGIPDVEGIAETANAIRICKGNSAVSIDKEGDVFLQHKNGAMFQIAKSAGQQDVVFVAKDKNPTNGFSCVVDCEQKAFQFSLGGFSIVANSELGYWMMGIFSSSGFDGIAFIAGVGIIQATQGVFSMGSFFAALSGVVFLGANSLTSPLTVLTGPTGDAAVPSATVFAGK